jgi:hypothetical protein
LANELVDKHLTSESTYTRESEKLFKDKGKRLPPYKNYYNEFMIMTASGILLASIQTAVPPFKPRKTFPGCVRSFTGYPLNGGQEDLSAVDYIACVIYNSKINVEPWDSLKNVSQLEIKKRLQRVIGKYVIVHPAILELYDQKRNYELLHPDETIPVEHSIQRWTRFLPPVVDYSVVGSLRNVGNDFKREFIEAIRKGHHSQREMLYVVNSKILLYSCGIVEAINAVVKKKDLLMKTASGNIPFLENACCNEKEMKQNSALGYFAKEDPIIDQYMKIAAKLGTINADVCGLSRPVFIYHDKFTGTRYPAIPAGGINENIVYDAIIHYCNLDNSLPIPPYLYPIIREKPQDILAALENNTMSLKTLGEKIELLKKSGKIFNDQTLHEMMQIIRRRRFIPMDLQKDGEESQPSKSPIVNAMKDLLAHFEQMDSTIITAELRALLLDVLDKYNPGQMNTGENDELNRWLSTANSNRFRELMQYIDTYGNVTQKEYEKLYAFFSGLNDEKYNHNTTTFFKTSVKNMTKIYPQIILSGNEFTRVCSHWGFSDFHQIQLKQMIEKHSDELNPFKKDESLANLLLEAGRKFVDLNHFIQNIPVQSELEKNGKHFHGMFSRRTTQLLFLYGYYSVLSEYMTMSGNRDLLQTDMRITRNARRNEIDESRDPANLNTMDIYDEFENLDELQIVSGNIADLKTKTCGLILAFIRMDQNNKKTVELSYEDISKKIRFSKEAEKRKIVENLGNMEIDERKIENMFKKYKMGKWNFGEQKGVFQYDKDVFNNETMDLPADTEISADVDELAADEIQNDNDQYEAEQSADLAILDEDYTDGKYYDEDMDADENYDF